MATSPGSTPWSPALQNSYGPEASTIDNYSHGGPEVVPHAAPEVLPHAAPEAVPGQSPYHGYVVKPYEARQPEPPPPKKKKKILGLSVALFWVIVGVVILLVLGISLGVGLGVGLSQRATSSTSSTSPAASTSPEASAQDQATTTPATTSSTSPTTTTSTQASSTSTAPVTSGTTGVADNSCISQVPTTYYSSADSSISFTTYCFTDWPNHDVAADGNGTVSDLEYTILYTFEDCMDACVRYNEGLTSTETKCAGVTYNSNLTSIVAVGQQGGNCFLKNTRGVNRQGSATSACAGVIY